MRRGCGLERVSLFFRFDGIRVDNGMMRASQARDPGSIPGSRIQSNVVCMLVGGMI